MGWHKLNMSSRLFLWYQSNLEHEVLLLDWGVPTGLNPFNAGFPIMIQCEVDVLYMSPLFDWPFWFKIYFLYVVHIEGNRFICLKYFKTISFILAKKNILHCISLIYPRVRGIKYEQPHFHFQSTQWKIFKTITVKSLFKAHTRIMAQIKLWPSIKLFLEIIAHPRIMA